MFFVCSTNAFYLPGTIVGALIVDKLGPKRTIILGFLLQALVGFILSGVYNKLKTHIAGFAIMYGLYLSLGELGPGNNLGLLAAKATGRLACPSTKFPESNSDALASINRSNCCSRSILLHCRRYRQDLRIYC